MNSTPPPPSEAPGPVTPPPPPRAPGTAARTFRWLVQHHFFGSFFIVVFATMLIASQVTTRSDFANSELARDVEKRWGAPVVQPSPSLRYARSGTVFTGLKPLGFDKQHVQVQAQMNYRKRGLRYFSGFDFTLSADYAVENREGHDIDVAFIFPIEMDKSQVLLSDLQFLVNGTEASLDLGESGNRLVWTGRLAQGATGVFSIRYRARGLDSFIYKMDPALPARDVRLNVSVEGGDTYDYPEQVLAATTVQTGRDTVALDWVFHSLQSGVSLGVILPSVERYDELVATMARRTWLPFLGLIVVLAAFSLRHRRPLALHEAYLVAATYAFFFILLAYLAAFMNFYVAYALAALGLGAAVVGYLKRIYSDRPISQLAALWAAALVAPSVAVLLEGYTGLVYTLELLAALVGLLVLSGRESVRAFLSDLPFGGAPPHSSATPESR